MKKVKPFLKMIMMFTLILCINSICGKASGPLDGQVIDGSLLTSDTVASDEQPLVLKIWKTMRLFHMEHIFQMELRKLQIQVMVLYMYRVVPIATE